MIFFADANEVKLDRYRISSDDGGGWYSKDVDLLADPFSHRYVKTVDETIVHNSHGTDVDDYYDEYVITPEEAIGLLKEANPSSADILKRFEESCRRAYKKV